jgi:maleate cis-trans isomerase
MPEESSSRERLGLIIPGIRSAGEEAIGDPETRHYEHWMRRFGFPHIRTVDAYTEANGRHDVESVFDTGREDKLVAAARELAGAGCAAVAWPCTCGSFIGGLAWSRSQADAMARVTALPVTSTSLAMLEAVTALGADTVDVVSAYPAPTTHRFLRFLDDAGIGVAAMVSLDCEDELLSHALNIRREVAQFTRSLSPRTHPLLIPDTAINAIALIADLEEDIGRPVVAGNQATLWHSLKLLGHDCRVAGAGVLLGGPDVADKRSANAQGIRP